MDPVCPKCMGHEVHARIIIPTEDMPGRVPDSVYLLFYKNGQRTPSSINYDFSVRLTSRNRFEDYGSLRAVHDNAAFFERGE